MRIHAHNFKTIFITGKPLLQTVVMIAVYVTILKVDVYNNFLKCVITDYKVENKLKKLPYCQASCNAKNTLHRF